MNEKKIYKSLTEELIDIAIDTMTKDVQKLLDLLPECIGDKND